MTSSAFVKWAAGSIGALLLIYVGAAVAQSIPREINIVCLVDEAGETFESCNTSDELLEQLPPCPVDHAVVASESRTARFVQLYWRLASCGQAQEAWAFQAPAYQVDNSPGGFNEFASFLAAHHNFEIIESRQVREQASSDGSGSGTARLQVDLLYFDSTGDSVTCTIDYVLQRPAQPSASWLIASSTGDGC